MPVIPRINQSDEDGVRVIRFPDRRLTDENLIREVADQLFAALPATGPIALIVDFTGVDQVSSSMLGKLILLQRRVDSSRGRLRLCELNPTILAIMKTTNLDRLFAIDRDRGEAREAFGPAGRS
jgi:anti-sigma B factor antagonist